MAEAVLLPKARRCDPGIIAAMRPGQRTWVYEHALILDRQNRLHIWTKTRKRSWFDTLFVPGVRIYRTVAGFAVEKWRGPWVVSSDYGAEYLDCLPVVSIPE